MKIPNIFKQFGNNLLPVSPFFTEYPFIAFSCTIVSFIVINQIRKNYLKHQCKIIGELISNPDVNTVSLENGNIKVTKAKKEPVTVKKTTSKKK